jgi:hypothetical protein
VLGMLLLVSSTTSALNVDLSTLGSLIFCNSLIYMDNIYYFLA